MFKRWIWLCVLGIAVSLSWADAPIDGRAGRAEVRFMQGMIDHHQMAIDMATHCLANLEGHEQVRAICQAVIDAQTPEIELLQGWLRDWYQIEYAPVSMLPDEVMQDPHAGHGQGESEFYTDPPMTMGMMAGLNRVSGADYAIAWLEAMIDHHDDAIHMAQRILNHAEHPALIDLANQIITDQSAEIEQMEGLLAEGI
ncbi:MAG: DUF305 domain-containing protein [Anaerolineae bacterium]|jgi:uncharacterized protein (DUF305 family)|nr:DUF305 domain-containing protein [Anaerolineae bacterium]